MREFNRMMKGRKMKGGPELRGLFQEKGPVTREEIEGVIRSGGAVIYYIKWSDQARYFVYPAWSQTKKI